MLINEYLYANNLISLGLFIPGVGGSVAFIIFLFCFVFAMMEIRGKALSMLGKDLQ